jgi:hypothetical protein
MRNNKTATDFMVHASKQLMNLHPTPIILLENICSFSLASPPTRGELTINHNFQAFLARF